MDAIDRTNQRLNDPELLANQRLSRRRTIRRSVVGLAFPAALSAAVAPAAGGFARAGATDGLLPAVHIYSSPDPDSVNSYAIEVDAGLVVVSAQRTFSEAERALARFRRTGKPVVAVVVPVAHTDHFGGLKIFAEAYPDAAIYAGPATIESLRTDGQGYIASRKEALGEDFPSPEEVVRFLPDRTLRDGEHLDLGGLGFEVIDLPNNNAPANTLLHLPAAGVLFSSEVVEYGVTAFMRDADLETWLAQVRALRHRLPGLRLLYPAHNEPAPAAAAFALQIEHLEAYRAAVERAHRTANPLTPAERAELVAEIERRFPDFAEVARLPRAELVGLNFDWLAAGKEATVAD